MAIQTAMVFETEDHVQFRTIMRGDEPWFVLADVCRALEIGNTSDAARRLDDDEKDALDIVDPIGRPQRATIINESGLYSLILNSRKEGAKRFKKWITSKVLPEIRKTGSFGGQPKIPAFIRRYNDNWSRVGLGFFSVINELTIRVLGRLEQAGHVVADKGADGKEIRPENSVGRLFADWLREHHPQMAQSFSLYLHKTPETFVEARQYPNSMLPLFMDFVDQIWIPEHAERYFKGRDPAALPYLAKMLPGPDMPRPGMMKAPTRLRLSK